jgi:hypothetical protein
MSKVMLLYVLMGAVMEIKQLKHGGSIFYLMWNLPNSNKIGALSFVTC